jgi:hypothetical protein
MDSAGPGIISPPPVFGVLARPGPASNSQVLFWSMDAEVAKLERTMIGIACSNAHAVTRPM